MTHAKTERRFDRALAVLCVVAVVVTADMFWRYGVVAGQASLIIGAVVWLAAMFTGEVVLGWRFPKEDEE